MYHTWRVRFYNVNANNMLSEVTFKNWETTSLDPLVLESEVLVKFPGLSREYMFTINFVR